MKFTLIQGDCLKAMKELPDNSVDACVTDPPYCLSSQRVYSKVKALTEIKGEGKLRENMEKNTAYGSIVRGFMGKTWDNEVAFRVDLWQEVLRVLKPGAHLLSFGGSRTYHRMACAIEDAGFEIRDMINWIYGSGFPKSLNIGKAIDKLQGNERKVLGVNPNARDGGGNVQIIQKHKDDILTKGFSEWEGWGTALKPAHEPIVLARKPLEGTVVENVLKHGVGGLNIDGCRIGMEIVSVHNAPKGTFAGGEPNRGSDISSYRNHQGRFPANLIHDGSEEVVELFPNSEVSGSAKLGKPHTGGHLTGFIGNEIQTSNLSPNDSGSAARFFYCAKANSNERNMMCEFLGDNVGGGLNATVPVDSRTGQITIQKNNHPTVKPIDLMKYLVKMVTKEGQTVLDPFLGSGTTMIACKELRRNCIGIEMNPDYVRISKARMALPNPFIDFEFMEMR